MSKYVTDEAMRSAMTLQKGYIDQGDSNNAEGIDSIKKGKNLLGGVLTGNGPYYNPRDHWGSTSEAVQNPTTLKHEIEVTDGIFSIKETGDNYIVSPAIGVDKGKTYTFRFIYINGGSYEIKIIGVGGYNNHQTQGGGGAGISLTFTAVETESVNIFVRTDDKKLMFPQLELGNHGSQFVASTEELKDYIDKGDKANAEGIEALRRGKNMLSKVLTGGVIHAGGWGSSVEAVQNPTLHDIEVTEGEFSIKEAGDNYFVSPSAYVEEGKTYTFSFLLYGGTYDIHIIGSQNNHQRTGASGGVMRLTFTSAASEWVRIFIGTGDRKLKNPQLELGSKVSQFVASTEDLKDYIDKGDKANAEGIESIEDRMEEVVQTQLITTPPATLNAQVGYYYCMGGSGVVVDTMTIQLPAIADKNKTKNVLFFMTMGSAPEVTFVSAGTERILYQKDFALEAERSYEVNALWNGHAWVITSVEIIVPPFFVKLTLNNGEVVELQGSGELTYQMVSPYGSSIVSAEIGELCTSIGGSAFLNHRGLTSVTIGSNVTSIGSDAFGSCTGLTSVTIPDSVTSIGRNAFQQCTGLTSVTIGSNVTSIGDFTFSQCSGLTSITSLATTAPTITSWTFQYLKTGGTLTVPGGSTGYDVWMGTSTYYLGNYGWTKVEQ